MASKPKTIVIFTVSYPYSGGKEQTFLQDEILITGRFFERVIIVPQRLEGDLLKHPESVLLDKSLAKLLSESKIIPLIKTVLSPLFYTEIMKPPYNIRHFRMTAGAYVRAIITKEWILKFLKDQQLNDETVLFYSFWMDSSSIGALFAKDRYLKIKVITRCHNADLYGSEDNYYHVAFQNYAVPRLDMNFPDSDAGLHFIKKYFPDAKCQTAIMGVKYPGFINIPSSDNIFRIVTCSYMIPRKRIELFLDGLILASLRLPEMEIIWYHIGDGPLKDNLINKASAQLPSNCKFKHLGSVSPERLMLFYKENAIDLFVNTSIKEGTPVSIMEAISCGIPLLATAICGNKEILDYGTGYPLNENPSDKEIAEALIEIITQDRAKMLTIRNNCIKTWNLYYNSINNYNKFYNNIIDIIKQK